MSTATNFELTTRQKKILDFIAAQVSKGASPTVREIGDHFKISSPNGVMCHLKALTKKGYIKHLKGSDGRNLARSMRLVGDNCPCCGQPTTTVRERGTTK